MNDEIRSWSVCLIGCSPSSATPTDNYNTAAPGRRPARDQLQHPKSRVYPTRPNVLETTTQDFRKASGTATSSPTQNVVASLLSTKRVWELHILAIFEQGTGLTMPSVEMVDFSDATALDWVQSIEAERAFNVDEGMLLKNKLMA